MGFSLLDFNGERHLSNIYCKMFFFLPVFSKKPGSPNHPQLCAWKNHRKPVSCFDGRVSRSGILWKILYIKDLKVFGLWSGLRLSQKNVREFFEMEKHGNTKSTPPQGVGWFVHFFFRNFFLEKAKTH